MHNLYAIFAKFLNICRQMAGNLVKIDFSNCIVVGDKRYISTKVQLIFCETVDIKSELPYRTNQKEWEPVFAPFAKAGKRIKTLFSQLCDRFLIIRNHTKDTEGLFTRIIGKISALTILQYIKTGKRLVELNICANLIPPTIYFN